VLANQALEWLPSIRAFNAALAILRQQSGPAIDWLREEGAVASEGNTFATFEHEGLTRTRVLLAEGSPASLAAARRDLEVLRMTAERGHHPARLVEILALSAIVLDAQGEIELALAHLQRSVTLAAPAGFHRTYVDLGPAIEPLLRRLVSQTADPYLERLLATAFDAGNRAGQAVNRALLAESSPHILETLTLREADVLTALSRRLSYQEIADELFISLPTVKSHVTHIYAKLGAANRRQALATAEAFGWDLQERTS
jgi:LuxR family maltose regulon positive regulatory protein